MTNKVPYRGKLTSGYVYGGNRGGIIEMLVDVSAYDHSQTKPIWIPFIRLAPGTAAVYPIKGLVPGRGMGQWKLSEVFAFRADPDWLARVQSGDPYQDNHTPAVQNAELRGDPVIDCSEVVRA